MNIRYKYFNLFCYYIIVEDKPWLSWGISILRFKHTALFLLTRDEMSFLWLFRMPAIWQWKFKGLIKRLIK